MTKRTLRIPWLVSTLVLAVVPAGPSLAKTPKTFLASDAAKEADEPQKFLPDYGKLVEGKDADWVFFPNGSLKEKKKVVLKPFQSNAVETHAVDARHAAEYAPGYLKNWLTKQGFEVVDSDGDMVVEGNVFSAWEPSTGARIFGGFMANPGCGLEVVLKDPKGEVLGTVRHKSRGSTIKDAVENGLEEVAKAIARGQ